MQLFTQTRDDSKPKHGLIWWVAVAWFLPMCLLAVSGLFLILPLVILAVWLWGRLTRSYTFNWKPGIALFLGATTLNGWLLWSMFHSTRRPDRFVMPSGYVGWVIVEYGVKGAPPLLREDGHDLHRIPTNGRLITSSPFEEGHARDDYFYEGVQGRRELTWGWEKEDLIRDFATFHGSLGVSDKNGNRQVQTPATVVFFVGTQAQNDNAGPPPHSRQMQKVLDSM